MDQSYQFFFPHNPHNQGDRHIALQSFHIDTDNSSFEDQFLKGTPEVFQPSQLAVGYLQDPTKQKLMKNLGSLGNRKSSGFFIPDFSSGFYHIFFLHPSRGVVGSRSQSFMAFKGGWVRLITSQVCSADIAYRIDVDHVDMKWLWVKI